jgi:putative restriction endonuclease
MDDLLTTLTSLRTGRVGDHDRPHKPALLLAILALADQGKLTENRVVYGPELFGLFRRYLQAVRTDADSLNMLDPFWRLRTDGILEPVPRAGFEQLVLGRSNPPTISELREITEGSRLAEPFFRQANDPLQRGRLREAIVSRYFANRWNVIDQITREEKSIGECEKQLEASEDAAATACVPEPVRVQAFRRVVLRAYDYRCAACGLRVIIDDLALVEAAHLIPWVESRDDDPRNGIALCKNHHWAMDQFLISPTPDDQPHWMVSSYLDDRIEGQKEMLNLARRSVLLPREPRFHPKRPSLAWRKDRLLGR